MTLLEQNSQNNSARTGSSPTGVPGGASKFTSLVFRAREFGIFGILIVFVLLTTAVKPRFLAAQNIKFILIDTTIFALLALGETMVVISKNVDLSIGSILGISAFVSSNLYQQFHHISIVIVFGVGIGIGLALGVVNGVLIAFGRVPSLVVTLASLYIIRGLDVLIVGGRQVVASSLPSNFISVTSASFGAIPVISIVVAIIVVGGAYYLKNYRSGRDLYAIGSSEQAAALVGIPIAKRIFTAFAISGAIAGLAGVIWASYYGTIDSTAGTGYEFTVVTAVVVGGVAIVGGSGSAIGAAIGALLLNTINSSLYVLGVSAFWDQAISGLLLILAIALDRGLGLYVAKSLRKRSSRVAS